jgi:hypothetical protein
VPDEIRIPNIEVLLQLAIKLRAIVLYLLENCKFNQKQKNLFHLFLFTATFDDLDSALKRLTTLKYLVNRYHLFFTTNVHILVAVRISSYPISYHILSI